MKTLLLINLLATKAASERLYGKGNIPDIVRLRQVLAHDEEDTEVVVITPNPTPRLAHTVEELGGTVAAIRDCNSGEAEVEMTTRALLADDTVRRIVFVTGSGAIAPALKALALDEGLDIQVAAFESGMSRSLHNINGVSIVKLDEFAVTRNVKENRT